MPKVPTVDIGAIAPWAGGKRRMAQRIIHFLGPHKAYWEPFCGGMAVLLAKPKSSHETVNDLHGDLINLARTLQSPRWSSRLKIRLASTLCDERAFKESEARLTNPFDYDPDLTDASVSRAYDFFCSSWMGRSGMIGTRSKNGFSVRYTPNGGHPGTRFASAVRSIAAWHARLRDITVLCKDGLDVLGKIADAQGVAVYCDPPYVQKGLEYVYDMNSAQHEQLAEELNRFKKARVVVSYYDNSTVDRLYRKWRKIPLEQHKNLSVQNKRGGGYRPSPEVLLVND